SHFGGTTAMVYKSKIRFLFVKLNVKNNPRPRECCQRRTPGETLLTVTSEDMVSKERKAADLKIK
ncbi:hypothetical protein F5887DRAFT_859486, partial [Amanita rubescens]